MAHYISRGSIPSETPYTVPKPRGKLYSEELVSTEGFSSDYSLLYHIHAPTQILRTDESFTCNYKYIRRKDAEAQEPGRF